MIQNTLEYVSDTMLLKKNMFSRFIYCKQYINCDKLKILVQTLKEIIAQDTRHQISISKDEIIKYTFAAPIPLVDTNIKIVGFQFKKNTTRNGFYIINKNNEYQLLESRNLCIPDNKKTETINCNFDVKPEYHQSVIPIKKPENDYLQDKIKDPYVVIEDNDSVVAMPHYTDPADIRKLLKTKRDERALINNLPNATP